eukprot:Hpha_TRINITY_DN15002_c1_g3::TRINITY_DN15002_c1_g3_i3::g.125214::m.125214
MAADSGRDELTCSISGELMTDAVVTPNGHTYSEVAILAWLQQSQTCPMSRQPLTPAQLVPNRAVRDLAEQAKHQRRQGAGAVRELRAEDVEIGSECLGAGSYGEVMTGSWMGTPVAVKRLAHGAGEAVRKAFKKEIDLLTQLQHPNVLRVFGVCTLDSRTLLVMDKAARSLADTIPRGEGMPLEEMVRIALGMVRGLYFLHTRTSPVTHCDLKPQNILLGRDGTPLLADFGIAHLPCTIALTGGVTSLGGPRGTANYTAPENLDDEDPDYAKPASDIFGLACILYEMAVGRAPWEGIAVMPIMNRVSRGRRPDLPPDLASPLANLITDCWAQDAAQRPSAQGCMSRLLHMERWEPADREILRMDIGHFVTAGEPAPPSPFFTARVWAEVAPGAEWLRLPNFTPPSPEAVAAVVRSVGGPDPGTHADVFVGTLPMLSPNARCELMILIDQRVAQGKVSCFSGPSEKGGLYFRIPAAADLAAAAREGNTPWDVRLVVGRGVIEAVVGAEAVTALDAAVALGEGSAGSGEVVYVLRRTEAQERWIGFHTDTARRTAQIPLNDPEAYVGGRLVFAHADGTTSCPTRTAGTILSHAGNVVHGVTAICTGRRYSLIATSPYCTEFC